MDEQTGGMILLDATPGTLTEVAHRPTTAELDGFAARVEAADRCA